VVPGQDVYVSLVRLEDLLDYAGHKFCLRPEDSAGSGAANVDCEGDVTLGEWVGRSRSRWRGLG